jgi:molybdopterin converting factor subunit 1
MTAPAAIAVRVRLFAMQREQAGARTVDRELPAGATIEDAWAALVERHPVLGPGRSSVRFARNGEYAEPHQPLEAGDEIACIPPVSGGASGRILELREEPLPASIVGDLVARLATDQDGGVVAFLGRTRSTPGSPAPGQEAEAARHAGRSVEGLEYEALAPMVLRTLEQVADEIEQRFGVRRVAIVHRSGEVPLGEVSVVVVACAEHRDAAFDAARYAIDETKARAPIWKAERFADGHVWIGEPARTTAPESGPSASVTPGSDPRH